MRGALRAVVSALQSHPEDQKVMRSGLRALGSLTGNSGASGALRRRFAGGTLPSYGDMPMLLPACGLTPSPLGCLHSNQHGAHGPHLGVH